MIEKVWHEFHDLPDTKDRKHCWVETIDFKLEDGRVSKRPHAYWSSSKATGTDLPLEYEPRQ